MPSVPFSEYKLKAAMWYPMGRPPAHARGVYHALQGAYGQNKDCKQRAHPGDQGWKRCVYMLARVASFSRERIMRQTSN